LRGLGRTGERREAVGRDMPIIALIKLGRGGEEKREGL